MSKDILYSRSNVTINFCMLQQNNVWFVCLKSTVHSITASFAWDQQLPVVVDEDMNVVVEVMEVTDSDTLMVISSLNPVGGTTMC